VFDPAKVGANGDVLDRTSVQIRLFNLVPRALILLPLDQLRPGCQVDIHVGSTQFLDHRVPISSILIVGVSCACAVIAFGTSITGWQAIYLASTSSTIFCILLLFVSSRFALCNQKM
jgi:hypothetical protein